MTALRRHLLQHRALAALLIAAALLVRVLVPAGFMPMVDHGSITVTLCSGMGAQTMQLDLPGKPHPDEGEHGKAAAPCSFASLAAPLLSGADPVLLAAAILFVMLAAVRMPVRPATAAAPRLRPPLRGPPAHP